MRTVWKFDLQRGHGPQPVSLPRGAQVVAVGVQLGSPVLWALVEMPLIGYVTRTFTLVNTGDPVPAGFDTYWGTMQDNQSDGVWHLFESESV